MLCREHGSFDYLFNGESRKLPQRHGGLTDNFGFGEQYKNGCPLIRKGFMEQVKMLDEAIALLESSSKYDFFYMIKHPEENDSETQKYVDYFRSIIDIENNEIPGFMEYFVMIEKRKTRNPEGRPSEWYATGKGIINKYEKDYRDVYYLRDDDHNKEYKFERADCELPSNGSFLITHRRFFLHKSTYHKGWDYENERPIDAPEDEKYISQDEFDCNVRRIIGELKWFRMVYIELNPKKMMDFTMQKIREYIRNATGIICDSEFYGNPVPFKENLAVYMANKGKEKRFWGETYNGISDWHDLLDDEKVREMKVQFDVNNPTGFDVSQRDFIDAFMDSMQFNNLPKETSKAIFTALNNKGMEAMKYFGQSKPQEKSAKSKAWERFNAKNPEFGKNPQKLSRQYDMISFISTFGAMYETTAEAEKDVNAKDGLLPLLTSFFGKDVRECPFDIESDERNKKLTVTMRIGEKQNDAIGENIITDASIICAMLAIALPSQATARKVSGIASGYSIYEGIQNIRRAYYGYDTCHPEFKFPEYIVLDVEYTGTLPRHENAFKKLEIFDYEYMMRQEIENVVYQKNKEIFDYEFCKPTFLDNRGYARDFYENYERDWNYYNQKLGELSSGILLNGI